MTMYVGLRTRLKPGCEAAYLSAHDHIWPEVVDLLRRVGVQEYLIFRDGLDLFHAIECDDWDAAVAVMADDPVNLRWQAAMAEFTDLAADMSGEGRDRLDPAFRLGDHLPG